jgi:predicted Zn finger-like uncharacterized protein
MLVFCDECGARHDVDPKEMDHAGKKFRCRHCNETLRIHIAKIMGPRLELTFRGRIITLDKNRQVVTIGRKPQNDFVFTDHIVSRSHAAVIYKDGQYMLIDLSKNGTYVETEGEQGFILKRDRFLLSGRGIINPVPTVPKSPHEVIHFHLR